MVIEKRCHGDAIILTLSAVSNDDLLGGLSRLRSKALDLLDDVHSLDDLAEHHVLSIEPLGLGGGEDSRPGVLQLEVLVLELVAVDGLASGSVSSGEVATLAHEVRDDTVEGGSLVAVSLLAGAQ